MSSELVESIWSTTSRWIGAGRGRSSDSVERRAVTALPSRKFGGLQQPVAPALDPLQRQPCRLGVLQHLRNAGASEPHLRGEVLTGMEVAVGKLAQQRESERSKPLQTRASGKSMTMTESASERILPVHSGTWGRSRAAQARGRGGRLHRRGTRFRPGV